MDLKIAKRKGQNKTESKVIRREGNIPAVLYSKGKSGENIVVSGKEFKKALNQIETGTLPTTIFVLNIDGSKRRAILKDVQYHITNYEVIHLDFEELVDGNEVSINVPIQCTGVVDCVGIKLGGSLRQVVRTLRVRCLPKNIPSQFEVDIRDMNVGQSKKVSEITLPSGVRPLTDTNTVAVVIAKR
jgi:large subunit ribosomal protein L25